MRFHAKKCYIRSSFAVLLILLISVLRTLRIVHSESVTFRNGHDFDFYVQSEAIGEKAALRAAKTI